MTNELEPLSADLKQALDVERARPPSSDEVLQRLSARIDATFAATPPGTGGGGSGGSGPASPAAGSAGAAAGGAGKLGLLLAGLAVGGAGGALLHAQLAEPVIVEKRVEVRVEVPVPVRVEVPVPAEPPPPSPEPAARPKASGMKPARAPLELQRLLVEQATAALGRDQPVEALAACDEHARQFPTGQHAEECESVAIQALARLGRKADATARAAAFKARYPDSLYIDVIERAVK